MLSRLGSLLALATAATAFSATKTTPSVPKTDVATNAGVAQKTFAAAAASASLAFALVGGPLQADAMSKTAGQISLNSIPPTSVKVDIRDLPVIGDVLSGTYTRVSDANVISPLPASVSITSPKDKLAAIKAAATGGHLEFDVDGLVATHLDIDVAADEAGVLTARVSSPLIPKLPFKNSASSAPKVGGKASDWSAVTNLGSGKVYYYNSVTDETMYEKPSKI